MRNDLGRSNFSMSSLLITQQLIRQSPARLLFGRDIRTKLPSFPVPEPVSDFSVRDQDASAKQRVSYYANAQRHAQPSSISAGDRVLGQDLNSANKLSPPYSATPHSVVARHGDQLVLQSPDHVIARCPCQAIRLPTNTRSQ